MKFEKVDPKQSLPEMERKILEFWSKNKVFKKSVEKKAPRGVYVFYDGPPFATGTPHYGSIVSSVMKDVVPRFWTMKGYKVERKWGWDCHGLPIENIAEKELSIKRKKEIEEMGVEKFNEFCRSKVLKYVSEWEKVIERLGRWADMKNAYKTMDLPYMESVWWVFKQLWDKGFIYEGYRPIHICTRCETTLSQQEVSEGYKIIKDLSAVVKFELADEEKTFVLAWTTTPWTLIGNVALAVKEDIKYLKIKIRDANLILAEKRIEKFLKNEEYKIISKFSGKELVGKKYKPLFSYYYQNEKLQNKKNGWKIYSGDFVNTEEGTGVVHIAPAFGEDDLNLGNKYNLPFIQHVGMDGLIKSEAVDFAGLSVKPTENHQQTDVEIIKYLANNNLLFAKEKYEHSYPHCWRCDTPLINYATSSWFVKVTKIKDEALKTAKNINWSPKHVKDGRFGNWLKGARDWSISRQRYWASCIPIWKCEKCKEIKVVGSIEEIKNQFGNPNTLFLIRHGEAENNVNHIFNSDLSKKYSLTSYGKKQVKEAFQQIKKEKIDFVFSSPFLRTKETADIIASKLGLKVIFDERLRELGVGDFEGKTEKDLKAIFPSWPKEDENKRKKFGVETETELVGRLSDFLREINDKYKSKNIVIISHGDPLQALFSIVEKIDRAKLYNDWYPEKGSVKRIYSKSVDLHKHIIDGVFFKCKKCGGIMKRIPDVLDTWFDSGSMPYAQMHYPFENKEKFEANFPAEFIAEGVDQTRAWFYYLHLIATAIKKKNAYKNVIVNGIVTGEDGKKLSKRLKNYPDPMEVFDKYGADALRFYLMSSPVVAAENLAFKESDVADLTRGMLRMLWNSYSFFTLYAIIDKFNPVFRFSLSSRNLLDKWIISELNILIKETDRAMKNYELNTACRLFPKFVDNLSNWYIRRSRKRFWKSENDDDKNDAYQTLYYVLVTLAKLIAPFMPFIAEEIYKNLTGEESVHLVDFPVADKNLIDEELNREMDSVRNIISMALQIRARNKIKVRQPIASLKIKNQKLKIKNDLVEIIKDEVNVKNVIFDDSLSEDVVLDTKITEELKLEGLAREIIRFIQEMRKEAGYTVDNRIKICYNRQSEAFQRFEKLIAKETLADELKLGETKDFDLGKELSIDGEKMKIFVKKSVR